MLDKAMKVMEINKFKLPVVAAFRSAFGLGNFIFRQLFWATYMISLLSTWMHE